MIVQICVGSSCHLEGLGKARRAVSVKAIADCGLEGDITLAGSFCTGKCNREGVTITVDDDIYTGVTPENFNAFFEDKILKHLIFRRE